MEPEMEQTNQSVCSTLPKSISRQISTCKNSEQYITNFLENALPSNDINSVAGELKKSLVLAKLKNKWNKKSTFRRNLLSNRKRMQLNLCGISDYSIKYVEVLQLNMIWLDYIQQILGDNFNNIPKDPTDPNWEYVNQQLMKADFHGAQVEVIKTKCPTLVGISGIVIKDTKNTLKVVGKDNVLRTIPKDAVIMNIYFKDVTFEFFGKDVAIKPTERTIKKLKCGGRIYEL